MWLYIVLKAPGRRERGTGEKLRDESVRTHIGPFAPVCTGLMAHQLFVWWLGVDKDAIYCTVFYMIPPRQSGCVLRRGDISPEHHLKVS